MIFQELFDHINEEIKTRISEESYTDRVPRPGFILDEVTKFFASAKEEETRLRLHHELGWTHDRGNGHAISAFIWAAEGHPIQTALGLRQGCTFMQKIPLAKETRRRMGPAKTLVLAELIPTDRMQSMLNESAEEFFRQVEHRIWNEAAYTIQQTSILTEAVEELGAKRLSAILSASKTVNANTGLCLINALGQLGPNIYAKETVDRLKALMAKLPEHIENIKH